MKYETPGGDTSAVEVTNVSSHGLWILVHGRELFLAYEFFPWFRNASIGQLVDIELINNEHLHWPELDLDLDIESILNPERYPLVSRVNERTEPYEKSLPRVPTEWDEEKIDAAVLALLQLTLHEGGRSWKGFDFEVMERLFQQGFIFDPRGKSESVTLTEKGLARSKELFDQLFGRR